MPYASPHSSRIISCISQLQSDCQRCTRPVVCSKLLRCWFRLLGTANQKVGHWRVRMGIGLRNWALTTRFTIASTLSYQRLPLQTARHLSPSQKTPLRFKSNGGEETPYSIGTFDDHHQPHPKDSGLHPLSCVIRFDRRVMIDDIWGYLCGY